MSLKRLYRVAALVLLGWVTYSISIDFYTACQRYEEYISAKNARTYRSMHADDTERMLKDACDSETAAEVAKDPYAQTPFPQVQL